MPIKMLRNITLISAILALFVVMLGAYTRLTDAGLGCPDWPGCYGHLVLPSSEKALETAQEQYPQIPIETTKAWTEMGHRYAAGTLGLLIFFVSAALLWRRVRNPSMPWQLALILIVLLLFQAALGMWTVTMKLLPVVVMGHLLGGILIFSCLCRLALELSAVKEQGLVQWHPWVVIGAIIVFVQIALGGWVSANYAGIACTGFPQCNHQWFPKLQLSEGFNLFSAIGDNYQGGILENNIRMTIQFIHRIGAVVTAIYLLGLGVLIRIKLKNHPVRPFALFAMLLVILQFVLGVINVVYLLPLKVAVAHNGIAAVLMATLFMMSYLTQRSRVHGD